MNVSGLIGIGAIVEEEKIGATMPILASPPKGNNLNMIMLFIVLKKGLLFEAL
jgi:hypothetical protein